MKREPRLVTAPPLQVALEELIEASPGGWVGVMGSSRVAFKLAEGGRDVVVFATSHSEARSAVTKAQQTASEGRVEVVVCGVYPLPVPARRLEAFFALGVFGAHRLKRVDPVLAAWSRAVRPGGVLAVAELAGEGWFGRMMLRLARRVRGRPTQLDPTHLCAKVLAAGTTEVRQVWPQGIGAWVLTHGKRSPLQELMEPERARGPQGARGAPVAQRGELS